MAYIVVVDDDAEFDAALATVLRDAGHEVKTVTDFDDAIPCMESRLPDLAILDVMSPEDDAAGFRVAQAMRAASEKLKNVPVLMLTAINDEFNLGFGRHDIDESWLPVSDFLEKPVDFDVLTAKVDALCQTRAR